jgi:Rhodanese-related sulfurtransferase
MRRLLIPFGFILVCTALNAQYQFDNVKFKTVYLEDLCQALQANPGFLILDVRSNGEFNDTSSYYNYNIGHLNHAININISQLAGRLNELAAYKDKPIFVYCSHSQRSRRASALLADSGFTHVYNINGGLTNFRNNNFNKICEDVFVKSDLPFTYISPRQFISDKRNFYIIDLRPDSAYRSLSSNKGSNVYGRLNGSVNIPYNQLSNEFSKIPKDRPVLLVDEAGSEGSKAAEILNTNGYKNVFVLFEGIDMFVNEIPPSERKSWIPTTKYTLINSYTLNDLVNSATKPIMLDIRPTDEYNNQSKTTWRNVGRLKNSMNIPFDQLENNAQLQSIDKNSPVIIYSFSSDTNNYNAADYLVSNGYKNVYVLMGGIFNTRWRAHNIKGKEYLNNLVENIP